ncbi:hypothetical protein HAX54_003577 [Datura stramonium]|uniref:Uncharacterized protein n=1 Tax=Datura stramonium TaxID=4076 RepID=A0ABS8T7T4_DATST|nr:hypothetical protein [Datura stramonium]
MTTNESLVKSGEMSDTMPVQEKWLQATALTLCSIGASWIVIGLVFDEVVPLSGLSVMNFFLPLLGLLMDGLEAFAGLK